jgi:phosphoribosylformylglycinamidine synthase
MISLGVACDGGKDSLSMAAKAPDGETVMAPGNLVISAYVGCPDITQVVTPDLKLGDKGAIIHVDLGAGRRRLGGSALAQAFSQLGDSSPDVTAESLQAMWEVTQSLISEGKISAGHDISDGGIATTLCEMAFAGVCALVLMPLVFTHFCDSSSCCKHGLPASIFVALAPWMYCCVLPARRFFRVARASLDQGPYTPCPGWRT